MLTRILTFLFGTDGIGSYNAHPIHILYSILFMAVGARTAIYDGWGVFGILTLILGALLGITIILAINWEKCTSYWRTIDDVARTLSKINSPEIYEAFGFSAPAHSVHVKEIKDHGQGFTSTRFHEAPVSPAILQSVANAVLSGASLSETEISGKRKLMPGSKFRQFSKWARNEKRKWITPTSTKDNRQGFALTRKGKSVFYSLASEDVKLQMREKGYIHDGTKFSEE